MIMPSILSSQGIVLATAMAFSGTVVLLVLRLQKSTSLTLSRASLPPASNIIPSNHVQEKGKKRVHFAEDVVEPTGNSEDYRKLRSKSNSTWGDDSSENIKDPKSNKPAALLKKAGGRVREMPANRLALYNGILRERAHKMRSSY